MADEIIDGCTYWWMKDCGWWRREGIIILGQEFGPSGPVIIDWLACEAKLQNDGGYVKSGPLAVAHGCFTSPSVTRNALRRAVELGVLEDYKEDRGRFTCRLSGWSSDQKRGLNALRQQRFRERKRLGVEPNSSQSKHVTQRDSALRSVTQRYGASPSVTRNEKRIEDIEKTPTSSSLLVGDFSRAENRPELLQLCSRLADAIILNDPKAKPDPNSKRWLEAMRLLLDKDGRSVAEVERVIDWCQADSFWRSNILSIPTLREKFTQLAIRMTDTSVVTVRESPSDLLKAIDMKGKQAHA